MRLDADIHTCPSGICYSERSFFGLCRLDADLLIFCSYVFPFVCERLAGDFSYCLLKLSSCTCGLPFDFERLESDFLYFSGGLLISPDLKLIFCVVPFFMLQCVKLIVSPFDSYRL